MPRVSSKKKEYMASDLTQWIIGRLYIKNLYQKDLAEKLGITKSALSIRMKNGFWQYKDLLTIFSYLEASDKEIIQLMKL